MAGSPDQLQVLGFDKAPDDFERVTIHFKFRSEGKDAAFDVLVYAKNPISIVQSTDHSMIGVNACAATKSNDVTLVYIKKHRVVVAPHASDWLDVGQGYGWFYIMDIKGNEVTFDIRQDSGAERTTQVKAELVFK
jgi:hypothetical protein